MEKRGRKKTKIYHKFNTVIHEPLMTIETYWKMAKKAYERMVLVEKAKDGAKIVN